MRAFYVGPGARMHDPELQTPEIAEYLAAEERALDEVRATTGGGINHIVEIGAGSGRYLPWAHQRGLHYDGLDIVARDAPPASAGALRGNVHHAAAEGIDDWIRTHGLDDPAFTSLVLFPFNCLGNVARIDDAIDALARAGCPIFLSLFRDDPASTRARLAYYEACGYTKLEATDIPGIGVRVTSFEGLRSYAYAPERVAELFEPRGFRLAPTLALGRVGVGLTLLP